MGSAKPNPPTTGMQTHSQISVRIVHIQRVGLLMHISARH